MPPNIEHTKHLDGGVDGTHGTTHGTHGIFFGIFGMRRNGTTHNTMARMEFQRNADAGRNVALFEDTREDADPHSLFLLVYSFNLHNVLCLFFLFFYKLVFFNFQNQFLMTFFFVLFLFN